MLDFLCIHPFLDGNGRVSRLITVLLLYKAGYYDALRSASEAWHENKNDYVPFIINFLQILYRCYKDLDEAFTDISIKKAKKTERVESILLDAIVPISKQDFLDRLPDISVQTVELVLNRLIKEDRKLRCQSVLGYAVLLRPG